MSMQQREAASTATTRSSKKDNRFCDICWTKSGHQGFTLQQCSMCNVCFHNECYGHVEQEKGCLEPQVDLVCLACRAVGKTIKVRQKNPRTKKHLEFTVERRPTECCLCGVDDGHDFPHAMHPVYETHGRRGRQLVLKAEKKRGKKPAKPRRLAWAHTLCAFAINCHHETPGSVFGCTIDGDYGYDPNDPDERDADTNNVDADEDRDDGLPDDASDNSELSSSRIANDDSIHHFVHPQAIKKNGRHAKNIQECQRGLPCSICKSDDTPSGVYRVPVRCYANAEEHEHAIFKGSHPHLRSECLQTMHVGCAMWGKNDGKVRRVYYFPGKEDKDPVVNVFCSAHAKEIKEDKRDGSKVFYTMRHFNRMVKGEEASDDDETADGEERVQDDNKTTKQFSKVDQDVDKQESEQDDKKSTAPSSKVDQNIDSQSDDSSINFQMEEDEEDALPQRPRKRASTSSLPEPSPKSSRRSFCEPDKEEAPARGIGAAGGGRNENLEEDYDTGRGGHDAIQEEQFLEIVQDIAATIRPVKDRTGPEIKGVLVGLYHRWKARLHLKRFKGVWSRAYQQVCAQEPWLDPKIAPLKRK